MEDNEIIDLYFARSEAAIESTSRKYGSYLHSISEIDRAVFLSRYFYAQFIEEIARNYDVAKGKVRYILFRSRAGLKAQFEKDGVAV